MSIVSLAFVAFMLATVLAVIVLLMVAMYQELGAIGLLAMPVFMATIFGPIALPDSFVGSIPDNGIVAFMVVWYFGGIALTVFCMQYGQSRKYSKR